MVCHRWGLLSFFLPKDGYEEAVVAYRRGQGPEVVGDTWEDFALEGSGSPQFTELLNTWYACEGWWWVKERKLMMGGRVEVLLS